MDEHTNYEEQGYTSPYPNPYAEQAYRQPAFENTAYGQSPYDRPTYGQPPYGQSPFAQPAVTHSVPAVKNAFLYIFMVLVPLKMLATYISAGSMMLAIDASHFLDNTFMEAAMALPSTPLDSVILWLRLLTFLFLILDVRELNKSGYPITGALLFGLFFRIGYFIWRAHLIGAKKAPAVVYTVFLCLMFVGYSLWAMAGMTRMLMMGGI